MRSDVTDRVKQQVMTYQMVFNSEQGAKVLEDLSRVCRADQSTFTLDDPNGRVSAFHEGRRYVILYIRSMMDMRLAEQMERARMEIEQQTEVSHV